MTNNITRRPKVKVVRAMKQVARLQGEIKELKKRVSSCLSTLDDNDFDESYKELSEVLSERIKKLIELKARIMQTNVKHGMFSVILNLGELKSRMDFLRELSPQEGFRDDRYSMTESKVKYKSQMTIAERNKLVEGCQTAINALTDQLDDFNAKTDLEELEVAVRFI